jgi:hypothetical protein
MQMNRRDYYNAAGANVLWFSKSTVSDRSCRERSPYFEKKKNVVEILLRKYSGNTNTRSAVHAIMQNAAYLFEGPCK